MIHTLETARLILRPHTMADVQPSYEMNLDPEVARYTHDGGVQDLAVIEQRIRENVLGDYEKWGYGRFAVVHKIDNRFIGFCGLKYLPDSEEVDLGYRLLRAYWGQGLATEGAEASLQFGFDTLGVARIIARAIAENHASVRVMQKLGMVFRERLVEDGEEVVKYDIDRPTWRAR